MKRVISIFMLSLMVLTSAHATWLWHFCGNDLRSVGIAGEQVACCCGETASNHEDETAGAQNMRQPFDSCCSDYTIKISTDDFSMQQQDITSEINLQILYPVLFLCNIEIKPDDYFIVQHTFPPGGLAKQHVDILASICILRI
jgi:hypothetical protein